MQRCSRFFLACLPSCYSARQGADVNCRAPLEIMIEAAGDREERMDSAVEVMQMWEVDSANNEDVRGMRAQAAGAVKACGIQQHEER